MPRIPEKRCPICGALYNVEPCNPSTHNALLARNDERAQIVKYLRNHGWEDAADHIEDEAHREP